MAVLSWIGAAVVGLAGCYSPELRDCAVSCATSAECAPGQVCGTDAICASPEVAGRCATITGSPDAGVDSLRDAASTDAQDAPLVDAAPPADAPSQLLVRIEIRDRGSVTYAGVGSCHYSAPMHICTFSVTAGPVATLEAVADDDYRFDKWELGPCVGQDETCVFLPVLPLTEVKAKFRRDD